MKLRGLINPTPFLGAENNIVKESKNEAEMSFKGTVSRDFIPLC
jgi:hypothetical protein